VTLPTILFAIIAVVGVFVGYRIWYRYTANIYYQGLAAICNAVFIIVFGAIYDRIALRLVEWENHRYDKSWENSLVTKTFVF